MKVYCLFEQSGSFKKVFNDLGFNAIDVDIENKYSETDIIMNLFNEIECAYNGEESFFDQITTDDLVFAFFPCTYFSGQNNLMWSRKFRWFKTWTEEKVDAYIENRLFERAKMLDYFRKFKTVLKQRGIRCIIENPYTSNYLLEFYKPDLVIHDRSKLGDNHKKPTMFYGVNFKFKDNDIEVINTDKTILRHNDYNGHLRSCLHEEFVINFVRKYVID